MLNFQISRFLKLKNFNFILSKIFSCLPLFLFSFVCALQNQGLPECSGNNCIAITNGDSSFLVVGGCLCVIGASIYFGIKNKVFSEFSSEPNFVGPEVSYQDLSSVGLNTYDSFKYSLVHCNEPAFNTFYTKIALLGISQGKSVSGYLESLPDNSPGELFDTLYKFHNLPHEKCVANWIPNFLSCYCPNVNLTHIQNSVIETFTNYITNFNYKADIVFGPVNCPSKTVHTFNAIHGLIRDYFTTSDNLAILFEKLIFKSDVFFSLTPNITYVLFTSKDQLSFVIAEKAINLYIIYSSV